LFAVFLVIAQVFGTGTIASTGDAVRTFVGLWVFAAFANMWFGLMDTGPGHTLKEEFPRFVAVLTVPIAIAMALPWAL
jgi:hypothetical protein